MEILENKHLQAFKNWWLALPKFAKIGIISTSIILLSGLFFYLLVLFGAFGKLPTMTDLRNIRNDVASEVYSEDGVLLGRFYKENRVNAEFSELSPFLINALVATEDARFFEHRGLDFRAYARVFFKTILMQDDSGGGGSTLSQQLAKNIFKRKNNLPVTKVREMILARRLERIYTKKELLNLYLNTVPFGESVYGVKVAAQRFFNTNPIDLKIEQAAVLVGMLKANTYYNPVRHPERAKDRRNIVLEQMFRYDYLNEKVRDSLQQLPLELDYFRESTNNGLATYFREYIRLDLEKLLKDFPKPDGSPYDLYTDGLKIHTTINARMQTYAEEAVKTHLTKLQKDFDKHWKGRKPWGDDSFLKQYLQQSKRYRNLKAQGKTEAEIEVVFNKMSLNDPLNLEQKMSPLDSLKRDLTTLHTGFLAMEPQTGNIKAWVGGIDYQTFQYDHVTSRRQVGSTFKPIVYAKAIQEGIPPCDYIHNRLVIYSEYDDWMPENSDGKYEGVYSMAGGLSRSVNSVTVDVLLQAGIDSVKLLAQQMGISSEIPAVPSIALGAVDASLMDMVRVYGTFANRGKRPEMQYLRLIESANGTQIAEFTGGTFEKVLTEEQADIMTHLMEMVVDSGTAKRLRYIYKLNGDIAGKTGTTQNQSDGWFMGYTPNLVAGVWVGAESPQIHFRTLSMGQGSNTALPVWGEFMKRIYSDPKFADIWKAKFAPLPDSTLALLDCPPFLEYMPDDEMPYELQEGFMDDVIGIFKKVPSDDPEWEAEKQQRKAERKKKRKQFFDKLFKRN